MKAQVTVYNEIVFRNVANGLNRFFEKYKIAVLLFTSPSSKDSFRLNLR